MIARSHWHISNGTTAFVFVFLLPIGLVVGAGYFLMTSAIEPEQALVSPHPSLLMRLNRLRWNPLESPLEQTRRLAQRDVIYMSFNKGSCSGHRISNSRHPAPSYDALRGLLYLKLAELSTSREYTSLDDCMASVLDETATIPGYAEFILRLSCAIPLSYGVTHGVDDTEEPAVMGDEATLRLFSRNSTFDNLPIQVEPTGLEICMRLTGWTYGREEPLAYTQPNRPAVLDQSLPIEWVSYILENRKIDSGIVEGKSSYPLMLLVLC